MTNPNTPQYGAPTPPPAGMPPTGVPPTGVPPQYGVPFQPPKKKAKKWPWIVGAIVVLFIIIAAVSGGGGDDKNSTETAGAPGATTAAKETATQEREDAPAGMNTPVRDGKFEFVVTDVQSGLESVGDNPYLTEQAQGQFVIVTMTVENTSDAPKGFSPSDQKLFDAQGRSFEPSPTAQIALGGSDIAVWDNINPGNKVTVKVVYDMPEGAVPASIELHDSAFSGGEKVSLK